MLEVITFYNVYCTHQNLYTVHIENLNVYTFPQQPNLCPLNLNWIDLENITVVVVSYQIYQTSLHSCCINFLLQGKSALAQGLYSYMYITIIFKHLQNYLPIKTKSLVHVEHYGPFLWVCGKNVLVRCPIWPPRP